MAIKKSELYSSLWQSCDELRGGMDASQYKDYVLTLLFVKYVSDKYAGQKDPLLTVPKGGGFADMVAAKNDKEIGDKLNKIINKLADANESLKGAINVADFNDEDKLGKAQAMVDRLTKLVAIFEGLEFGKNRAEGDDLLGDAYEYLMRHFATESGKSKGQFYTPAEVSRVMSQVIGLGQATRASQSIYDPTCGSGSLLLKAHDEAKSRTGLDLALYGQEMDNATSALARMNTVLHDCPTAEIWQDNTLAHPHFKQNETTLKTFDYVVANPPFSFKAWSSGFNPANDLYGRFEYGIPPVKNGDYAFLLHILKSLKSNGKGAVILPHGVLFRGNVEADIRTRIVKQGYIKGIIGLPANLFYGTGIPACIVVLDKENAAARKGIFMIDASKGFIKDGNKNRLRAQDIHKIVDTFNKQLEIDKYSRLVPLAKIEAEGYNLNLPRYIDSTEPEDLQSIEAHLNGGIPVADIEALQSYWDICPNLRTALFKPNRPSYLDLAVEKSAIKPAIYEHHEFAAFIAGMNTHFDVWRAKAAKTLKALKAGFRPKEMIASLAEDLLAHYKDKPLIDQYDVYQHLMDYWAEIMQDDCYLIAAEGWLVGNRVREIIQVKNKDGKLVWPESHDYKRGKRRFKSDLIPAAVLINRYFKPEQEGIAALENAIATLEQQLDERREEQGAEGGLLEEVVEGEGDKQKITAKAVKVRLKEIGTDAAFTDEQAALREYADLLEKLTEIKSQLKQAQDDLDAKLHAKCPKLTEAEIKTLVVDDKWLAALDKDIHGEMDRISQRLTQRVKELAERYETPLPHMISRVAELEAKVNRHLEKMGFAWK